MNVRTSTTMPGTSQRIEVELGDADMAEQDGFADLSAVEKFRAMSRRADSLVVEYMLRNEHISPEFAAQRMSEIRGA